MNIQEFYRRFDGIIPRDEQHIAEFETPEYYARAFAAAAERNFYRRCRDLVSAISTWRVSTRYPRTIRHTMLERLGSALNQSRYSAVESFIFSKVAVTAAPASTA